MACRVEASEIRGQLQAGGETFGRTTLTQDTEACIMEKVDAAVNLLLSVGRPPDGRVFCVGRSNQCLTAIVMKGGWGDDLRR